MSHPTPQQMEQVMVQVEAIKRETNNVLASLSVESVMDIQRDMDDLLEAVHRLMSTIETFGETTQTGANSMNTTEYAIREHITQLLAHEIDLKQFMQWFVTEAYNIQDDMAYEIKLLFAEYDHGDWTPEQMTEHLREILEHPSI